MQSSFCLTSIWLLILLATISASAAAAEKGEKADAASNWLFCNTTASCRVSQARPSGRGHSPLALPLELAAAQGPTAVPLQSCGALQLNEHCRAAGGYSVEQCLVSRADWQGVAQFKRELSSDEGLQLGAVVTQHRSCTPQSRFSVGGLMTLCALCAAAALLVVRLRALQLRRQTL